MALDRLLASQGFGSRKQCRQLVLSGRVSVLGALCTDPSADFELEGLHFAVDGESWEFRQHCYLMMHKPAGFECSQKPAYYPSVYSLLPLPLRNRDVQSVGRLDEDTTGLLLFSDDGQFIHTYTSPRKRVGKTYEITLKHPADEALCSRLLAGVQLNDEPNPIAATACQVSGPLNISMCVTEGKYHLVKRMVAAAGNRVEGLHRSRVGQLCLPADLAAGQWRWLSASDMDALCASEGGADGESGSGALGPP